LGQLCNAVNNGTTKPNPTPIPVTLPGALGPVTQVAAGVNHSLAVTAGGQLYAFGETTSASSATPPTTALTEPNPAPTQVALPGEVGPMTRVGAGAAHSSWPTRRFSI
jgi:alpha-tubulin suppressor-like RCC1 family protein